MRTRPKASHRLSAPLVVFLLGVGVAAAQQINQDAIVSDLSSGDATVRARAVGGVLSIQPEKRTDELWVALSREFRRAVSEYQIARKNRTVSEGQSEYVGALLQVVTGASDESLIPAFATMIDSGEMATTSLARYGEQAVSLVLAVAEDPRASAGQRAGAVHVLEQMLRGPGVRIPLSGESKARISGLARVVLDTKTDNLALYLLGIDLAVATRDPSLVSLIRKMAADPAVQAHKVGLERATGAIQVRARDALGIRSVR